MSSPMYPLTCKNDGNALEFIEEITKNADNMQKDVLAKILTQNAETEYLKGFLNGATDMETFKSKIPIATYEDLQPLIRRIANGDRSPVLSAHPVIEFLSSSGTSGGEPKLIPVTADDLERRLLGYSLLMPVMNQYIKGLDKGKALYFKFVRPETKTPGGIVAQPATTSFYKSSHSKTRPDDPHNIYTSPNEAILCVDFFQSMYIQMLCGLYHHDLVVRVGASFATGLIRASTFLQHNWQQLTHDIRTGSLNPEVTDPTLCECMSRVSRPDPTLADFIAHEWEGIIPRIWPNTRYIDAIVTGSMAQYIPILNYYSGDLPIVCTRYVSSECFIGINLNPISKPSEVCYTILPNMAYFEFLRVESDSTEFTRSSLVDLVDVEIGKEYELVVTTYSGLYRYPVGDILRVASVYNSTPQFQFIRRKNAILSIDAEKTDEAELQLAVNNASELLREFNTYVVEYTSYSDTTTIPGHYVIYLELLTKDSFNSPSDEVLVQCCLAMERSFNTIYRILRTYDKLIGPLEIRIVRNGTFEELMDFAISRGASVGQYKVARCVNFMPILNLLDSRVVSTHFSPSLPY